MQCYLVMFPTLDEGRKFEKAWQLGRTARCMRAAASFQVKPGPMGKIMVLSHLLRCARWLSLQLTIVLVKPSPSEGEHALRVYQECCVALGPYNRIKYIDHE